MAPKISVIIPVYNVEKYFKQCIESVINQTLKDIEIILVDDGSTDSSGKICDEYREKDDRITVIHQKNQYVGVARNNGMAIAKGEYLICLDSDDWFDSEMLESMYNRAVETDADITICREKAYYEKEQKFADMFWSTKQNLIPKSLVFSNKDIEKYIFQFTVLWPWDKLYKHTFLTQNGITYPNDRIVEASEDLVFVGHTVALANKITVMNNVFVTHRYHSKSLEANRSLDTAFSALKMLHNILKDKNVYKNYEQSFINLTLHYFMWDISTSSPIRYKKFKSIVKSGLKYFNIKKYGVEYFYNKTEYYSGIKVLNPILHTFMNIKSKIVRTKLIIGW